jgi:diaminopimelate decarboxylase/aspartate kinase
VIAPCAAITLVGRGMRSLLHKLSEVWAAFGRERVHLISQSSNDLNLTFVVDEADADGLLPSLHAALVKSGAMPVQDGAVFGPRWRELTGAVRARAAPWWRTREADLHALAAQGTPRYVYHLPTLRERARQIAAVAAVDQRFYAIKANAHPALLAALAAEGFGFECVSLGEIEHVRVVLPGLAPSRLLFTPSFAPRAEYAAALAHGVTVTLDNIEQLEAWPELWRGRSAWLRLDTGHGDGHHEKVVTGGAEAKFGLPLARLDAFVARADAVGLRITGLHAHLGSGIHDPAHWRRVYAELAAHAAGIGTVASIDVGGGLPVPYRPDDVPFALDAWAAMLAEVKASFPDYALVVEPGRFLVAECGVLLARVTQVVEKDGVRRIGLDAGMNALLRPALYDAWHGIHVLGHAADAPLAAADVVGPICESGDVLGRQRPLPAATREGDLVLIADAGAYGHVMASTYNLRALPEEEILDDATH